MHAHASCINRPGTCKQWPVQGREVFTCRCRLQGGQSGSCKLQRAMLLRTPRD